MSIEAMKQALDVLENTARSAVEQYVAEQNAIHALRQAIEQAEKQFNPDWDQQAVLVKRIRELEAQQALDKKADNARELGLDYESTHTDHPMRHWDRTCPACVEQAEKQEPVACKHKRYSNDVTEDIATCYDCGAEGRMRFVANYTAPPRKEWVGLTELEIKHYNSRLSGSGVAQEIEAKLREKNGG